MTTKWKQTNEDALRAFLLEVLLGAPLEHLHTQERRVSAAIRYEALAQVLHPAVSDVLRDAAERLRNC
ncbi:hypothetical protein [Paracoccus binzhouensis]|uniref:hypothetical protein n=1 Tax=Paracoccus binzhouensis TaxID=2796149 RepID=UPI0018EED0F8|nr:hypothetical protein [Paracoccus binzhouensis]